MYQTEKVGELCKLQTCAGYNKQFYERFGVPADERDILGGYQTY